MQKIFLKKQEYLEFLRAQLRYYIDKKFETAQIHSAKVEEESKSLFKKFLSFIGVIQLGLSDNDYGWSYKHFVDVNLHYYHVVLMHEKEIMEVPQDKAELFWEYKASGQIYDKVLMKYVERTRIEENP